MTAREQGHELDPVSLQVVGHALVGSGEQVGRWWLEHPDVLRAEVVDRFLAVARGAIAAVQRLD
jgi:membrane protein required for beta-lactamase induction